MSKHSADAGKINYFQLCWDLGYHNLLPVVPPDGGIQNAGKRPGVVVGIGAERRWVGKASRDFSAGPDTIAAWHAMGASVGLSCNGTGFCGIDIDTLTLRWVDHIAGLAHEMLGPAPRRIGRAPKLLLPYNCPAEMRYAQVRFRDDESRPVAIDGRRVALGLVECLAGDTKWFVGYGTHPQTRQPYDWPDGMPRREELTTISLAQRDALLEQLRRELPDARRQQVGEGAAIDVEKLRGDPRLVAAALRTIPNDPEIIGYDEWRNIGIALRGAIDNYSDGLELFQEWTDRAGISEADATEKAHRVFGSVESARRLGAEYIYDKAEQHGWIGRAVERWFVEPGSIEIEQPYESIFGGDAVGWGNGARERFPLTHIDDVAERALNYVQRPLVKGLLDEQTMSVVYGDSNVGKTFVITDLAYHIASGRAYAGMAVTRGAVVYVTTEGGRGVDDRLLALRTRFKDGPDSVPFYLLSTDIDLHAANGDVQPLVAAIEALGVPVSLVVVDVLAQAMGQGEENATRDMVAMVRNGNRIIRETRSHLMWIHHTGKDASKGARGSSSLRAGTDTELEVAEGTIIVTKQRNLGKEWSTSFRLVPFTAGVRRKVAQMIDTCIVELLPKTRGDRDMISTRKEIIGALAQLGARSEERAVLVSDVVAWSEDNGKKLKTHVVRMRLNRLVDLGECRLIKRGGHSRYYLIDDGKIISPTSVFD